MINLEPLSGELFTTIDPATGSSAVGATGKTITDVPTLSPNGAMDWTLDYEWSL